MPHFWEHFGDRGEDKHRNLQDGLFQIASQTCSLFVHINNTNNISYGNNTANIHVNGYATKTYILNKLVSELSNQDYRVQMWKIFVAGKLSHFFVLCFEFFKYKSKLNALIKRTLRKVTL